MVQNFMEKKNDSRNLLIPVGFGLNVGNFFLEYLSKETEFPRIMLKIEKGKIMVRNQHWPWVQ